MKSIDESIQKYRAAVAHKQALIERRREIEVQRAQLTSERASLANAIQRIRDEIQQSTSLDLIKEGRRRIASLEADYTELDGLLGERVLDPAEITAQIGVATRESESHRRVAFTAKLAEILATDEAKSAKAFLTKMQACLLLSGADSPDLDPSPVAVAAAQRDLIAWLEDNAA